MMDGWKRGERKRTNDQTCGVREEVMESKNLIVRRKGVDKQRE